MVHSNATISSSRGPAQLSMRIYTAGEISSSSSFYSCLRTYNLLIQSINQQYGFKYFNLWGTLNTDLASCSNTPLPSTILPSHTASALSPSTVISTPASNSCSIDKNQQMHRMSIGNCKVFRQGISIFILLLLSMRRLRIRVDASKGSSSFVFTIREL